MDCSYGKALPVLKIVAYAEAEKEKVTSRLRAQGCVSAGMNVPSRQQVLIATRHPLAVV